MNPIHPMFAQVFHEFFVRGTHIDRIAAIHELSFREVTDILNCEEGLAAMHDAIRVERLRYEMDSLASRRRALGALECLVFQRDNSIRACESRRRAADAILRNTKPNGKSSLGLSSREREESTQATPAPRPISTEPQAARSGPDQHVVPHSDSAPKSESESHVPINAPVRSIAPAAQSLRPSNRAVPVSRKLPIETRSQAPPESAPTRPSSAAAPNRSGDTSERG